MIEENNFTQVAVDLFESTDTFAAIQIFGGSNGIIRKNRIYSNGKTSEEQQVDGISVKLDEISFFWLDQLTAYTFDKFEDNRHWNYMRIINRIRIYNNVIYDTSRNAIYISASNIDSVDNTRIFNNIMYK